MFKCPECNEIRKQYFCKPMCARCYQKEQSAVTSCGTPGNAENWNSQKSAKRFGTVVNN